MVEFPIDVENGPPAGKKNELPCRRIAVSFEGYGRARSSTAAASRRGEECLVCDNAYPTGLISLASLNF